MSAMLWRHVARLRGSAAPPRTSSNPGAIVNALVGLWVPGSPPPRVDAGVQTRVTHGVGVSTHDARLIRVLVPERRMEEAVGKDRIARPRVRVPGVVERGAGRQAWLRRVRRRAA